MDTQTTTPDQPAPPPPLPTSIPVETQAAIRRQCWELCAAHGLRYPFMSRVGSLEIAVGYADGGIACRNPNHAITVIPVLAVWLLEYHRDPARYRGIPVEWGGADALLTIIHETIHICWSPGTDDPAAATSAPRAGAFELLAALHAALPFWAVIELIVELAAREVAMAETQLRPSQVQGGYDALIAVAVDAVCAELACDRSEALDRLARAAVRVARECNKAPQIEVIDRLLTFATEAA